MLPTAAAYAALLPEIEAVTEGELSTVNIDMMAAITTVTGTLPEIRALRTEIAASLPNFDLQQFDKLEQYTLALTHAHSRYRKMLSALERRPQGWPAEPEALALRSAPRSPSCCAYSAGTATPPRAASTCCWPCSPSAGC